MTAPHTHAAAPRKRAMTTPREKGSTAGKEWAPGVPYRTLSELQRQRAAGPAEPTLHRVDTTELQHGAAPRFVAGCCSQDRHNRQEGQEGRACQGRRASKWQRLEVALGACLAVCCLLVIFAALLGHP